MNDEPKIEAHSEQDVAARQVPLWEQLERVPKDVTLSLPMFDESGKVFGYTNIPVGHLSHAAAKELRENQRRLLDIETWLSAGPRILRERRRG